MFLQVELHLQQQGFLPCSQPVLRAPPLRPRPVLTPLKATQEVVHVELLCGSAAFYCPVGLTLFFRKSRVVRASDENSFVEHQIVFSRFAYASGNHRTEGSFCFRFPFGSAVSAGVYRTITSWFLGRMGQGGREWADPCFLSGIKNAQMIRENTFIADLKQILYFEGQKISK